MNIGLVIVSIHAGTGRSGHSPHQGHLFALASTVDLALIQELYSLCGSDNLCFMAVTSQGSGLIYTSLFSQGKGKPRFI